LGVVQGQVAELQKTTDAAREPEEVTQLKRALDKAYRERDAYKAQLDGMPERAAPAGHGGE